MFLSPNPLNPDYKQWAVNHAIALAAALMRTFGGSQNTKMFVGCVAQR